MAQAQQAAQPNRKYPKKPGKNREAHTQNSPYGMGDSYGVAKPNKNVRVKSGFGIQEVKPGKLKKPPRTLA